MPWIMFPCFIHETFQNLAYLLTLKVSSNIGFGIVGGISGTNDGGAVVALVFIVTEAH